MSVSRTCALGRVDRAAQMKAVNDRLVAVKMGLASQAHAGSSASQSKAGG
jgi:hypothetical protein